MVLYVVNSDIVKWCEMLEFEFLEEKKELEEERVYLEEWIYGCEVFMDIFVDNLVEKYNLLEVRIWEENVKIVNVK